MAVTKPSSTTPVLPWSRALRWSWHSAGLVAVIILVIVLHLFQLEQNGFANPYYAAAVKSMLMSWRNFFFVAFDPGGFVSVDKPPLALWIQALSAAVLGFNGVSLLLPQVLAGIIAVILIYHLVGRVWGPTAGLIAALTLTLTPISIAINRDNNPDPLLVLALMLAAWQALLATETGRLRYLLLCGVFVGLGFNIKMLQALIVLPALGLIYLLGAPHSWGRRIVHLALATGVLLVVSLAWVVAVDLTPPTERPYVGGSTNNTVMDLIVGYNGLGRIFGGEAPGGAQNQIATFPPPGSPAAPANVPAFFNAFDAGQPGPLRLFEQQLSAQISWLLPLVALGVLALVVQERWRVPLNRQQQSLVLWGLWLLTHMVVFSFAQGIFHKYYLVMLAPAIAALVGAGSVALWDAYRAGWTTGGWRGWLLPLALLVTVAWEARILLWYMPFSLVLIGLVLGGGLIVVAALVVARLRQRAGPQLRWHAAGGLLCLLLSPGLWSVTPLLAPTNGVLPAAGPEALFGGFPLDLLLPELSTSGQPSPLLRYLQRSRQDSRYLVATTNAIVASPLILATDAPVMTLGGFLGTDPILTSESLATLVQNNTVRSFLLFKVDDAAAGAGPAGPFNVGSAGELGDWVRDNCAAVPSEEWRRPDAETAQAPFPPPGLAPGGLLSILGGSPSPPDFDPGALPFPRPTLQLYHCS